MTAYTSGKVTHDPYPYVWSGHTPHNQMRTDTHIFRKGAPISFPGYVYLPRPLFDNHNPILVEYRSRADSLRGLEMEAAYDRANGAAWKKAGCPEFGQDGFTEWCAYEDHAWRVLERIADLTHRLTENGVTD